MKHNTYEHLCSEAEAGRDVFVRHPKRDEEGRVTGCVLETDHLIVKTTSGEPRCWDAGECEELIDLKSRAMIS